MEKVLFVFPDYNPLDPSKIGGSVNHGIAYLAGALRNTDVPYSLLHLTSHFSDNDLVEELSRFDDCNIVAMSFMSGKKDEAFRIARIIKSANPSKYVVAGGVHPIVSPEEVIKQEAIDCVCMGEGEFVLPGIVRNYRTQNFDSIPNIIFKKNRALCRNDIADVSANLDDYPSPDYSIFDFKKMHCYKARIRYLPVILSRGCPYDCSFCSNFTISKRLKTRKSVRMYSPRKAVSIIKENLRLADWHSINFDDDVMGLRKDWMNEFYRLYKQEIDLPFKCNIRPEYIDEGIVSLMKYAGCFRIISGLETGVESIRFKLNKRVKNADFIRCFALFRKYGIGINTNSMIGLPYETFADSLQTIKFNAKYGIDISLRCIFTPYRFTSLYDYCVENDLLALKDKKVCDQYDYSLLKLRNFSNIQMQFLLASWNLLLIVYKRLYKFNNEVVIGLFDFFIVLLRPVYPVLIFLRRKFFIGKLSTYLYKKLERNILWAKE